MVSDIRTKGIVAFRNSESTFRCWSITTTQRGMAASELRNLLGMEVREQPATQLYSCRVKKDNEHVIALANIMKDLWHPDKNSASTSEDLLNIASRKATTKETRTSLLQTLSRGHEQCQKFEVECAGESLRFLQTVPRMKGANLTAENKRIRNLKFLE